MKVLFLGVRGWYPKLGHTPCVVVQTEKADFVFDLGSGSAKLRDVLRPVLRIAGDTLRYVVFDTAPSVGGLQERALWAADLVVIPSSPFSLGFLEKRFGSKGIRGDRENPGRSGADDWRPERQLHYYPSVCG